MATDVTKLNVGDVIEAPPLMQRLSHERVLMTCTAKTEDSTQFAMTYHGVTLAHVAHVVADGKGTWKWLS